MKGVRICILFLILFGLWILPVGCGGGGGGEAQTNTPQSCSQLVPNVNTTAPSQTIVTSGTNVQTITVNGGPLGDYPNAAFTSVTVCDSTNSNCQTIKDVLVDTGSSGLILLYSALSSQLQSAFKAQRSSSSNFGECVQFADFSYIWGPVQTAYVQLAGEATASAIPIHILGDPTFSTIPSTCSGAYEADDLDHLGANGILGIGPTQYDCSSGGTNYCCSFSGNGITCSYDATQPWSVAYYACTSSSCTYTSVPVAQQVQNPVALFSTDNNGVIIELPFISGPTATLTGSMVFGIDTSEGNNSSSGTTKFYLDSSGNISTMFNSKKITGFIDSGSNGYFFTDTSITQCTGENAGWYCPPSKTLVNLTATNSDNNSDSNTVSFSVGNAADMFNSCQNDYALNTLGGTSAFYFDWGLPFFYGRNVYTAIDTMNGNKPYWAY